MADSIERDPPVLADITASTSSLDNSMDGKKLHWDGPNDPGNPYNWSAKRKWFVAGVSLLGTLVLPINGTGLTVGADLISQQFNVADTATFTNTYWLVTSWTVGGGIFVIMALPLMEEVGVRRTYLLAYIFLLFMMLGQALAQNFATLIITRFFAGGCITLLSNAIASLIPDLWTSARARTLPISLYIQFYVVGNSWGPPLFAGVVDRMNDWRWILWVQLMIFGGLFPLFFFSVRETRGAVILRRRTRAMHGEKGFSFPPRQERRELLKAMGRPMYLLCTEPVLFVCALWSAFALGTAFLFTQSTEQVFSGTYGWSSSQCGYIQAAVVIGEILGSFVSYTGAALFFRSAKWNKEMPGEPIPEARLYMSVIGSLIGMTGGMFVYAWTAYPTLPWIAPAIGLAMVGFGIEIVVSGVADYITDAYADSGYNGSALCACAFAENILSGLLPLASQSMYTNLGYHWASTLLGFLALLLSLAPAIIISNGRALRERSPYMTSTNKMAKAAEQHNEQEF